jgi:hypothetical protein
VLVFQFVAPRWSRRLPAYLVGVVDHPDDAADGVEAWVERGLRIRRAFGVVLLAIAVAGLAGADTTWGKPLLAGVSIASALGFLAGYVRDRVRMGALSARARAPAVRTAALEPRTLRDAYRPAWEAVPFVAVGLTLAGTLWAVASDAPATLFGLPALQLAVVGGGLVLSVWHARRGPELPQRVRAALGDPATALAISQRIRMLELRALLGAKIGVAFLLAVMQAGSVVDALGYRPAPVLDWLEWSVVVGMLVGFAVYLLAVTAVAEEELTGELEPPTA